MATLIIFWKLSKVCFENATSKYEIELYAISLENMEMSLIETDSVDFTIPLFEAVNPTPCREDKLSAEGEETYSKLRQIGASLSVSTWMAR